MAKRKNTMTKSNIKSKYQLRKEKFKFEVGDIVIHLGSLYDEYKHKPAKVLSRSTRKSTVYYMIEFEDGKQMEVKELWISDTINKTINKSEESL